MDLESGNPFDIDATAAEDDWAASSTAGPLFPDENQPATMPAEEPEYDAWTDCLVLRDLFQSTTAAGPWVNDTGWKALMGLNGTAGDDGDGVDGWGEGVNGSYCCYEPGDPSALYGVGCDGETGRITE
ncbi:hypothetical protein HK101_001594, partial [Irineochytrium annulatum]